MNRYALLFRSTRSLEPEALARRNDAAREWALALGRAGRLHSASPLLDEGARVSQLGVNRLLAADAPASVLVVEAVDLDSAIALVKEHPGLAYGTEIEVRPVRVVQP